jgi:toxin FitB
MHASLVLGASSWSFLHAMKCPSRRGSIGVPARHECSVGAYGGAAAAVCQDEILSGLAVLDEGRRRSELEVAARAMLLDDFEGRVLPFDTVAAESYADMYARRRRAGRPVATADLMIAAIARVHGASVVTRNVADFDTCGVPIVEP